MDPSNMDKSLYEYAIVCNPGQPSPTAPDQVIDNNLIATLRSDSILDKLIWQKLGQEPTNRLDANANASIRLTVPSKGSWPLQKVSDWPESLGLWQCSCKASPKWKGTYMLIRQCITLDVVLTMVYVPDESRLPNMTINFIMCSGHTIFTSHISALAPFGRLLDEVYEHLSVPDHRRRFYKFTWVGSNKPMTCTSKVKMTWPIVDVVKAGSSTRQPQMRYQYRMFQAEQSARDGVKIDPNRCRLMSLLDNDLRIAMIAAPSVVVLPIVAKRQRIE
jgi:hypothetical protein